MMSEDYSKPSGRIITQVLKENGVWTEWENGVCMLMPYKVNENGEKYADLDPNKELFDYDENGNLLPTPIQFC